MLLATSKPFRKPPEDINGSLIDFFAFMRLAAVGIPQFQNNVPK